MSINLGEIFDIDDDIRLTSCGPHAGFAEPLIRENGAGSSIHAR
jgi:fumarate hydratase class II